MKYEAEFEQLYTRGTDYGELLKRGQIERLVPDPDEWRAEIRRQARRDQVRVRTFVIDENVGLSLVLAVTISRSVGPEHLAAGFAAITAQKRALALAVELGHEMGRWTRSRDRQGARCERCGARLYIEVFEDRDREPIVDGEAVEDECL